MIEKTYDAVLKFLDEELEKQKKHERVIRNLELDEHILLATCVCVDLLDSLLRKIREE